jgi:leucyl aminopeptidase
MKAEIQKTAKISPDQSVVCIMGSDQIPGWLTFSNAEREFVKRQLLAKEEFIFINLYNRCIYLIRLKEEISLHKIREELRRTAYNMRIVIKGNNHSELVVTSENAYAGAIEDFAEGLILSIYSFDKYKTKTDEVTDMKYPARLLLKGEIADSEIKWLVDLTDAVYFTRDLINEPVNHLNAETLAGEIKKIGDSA